jgi:hypothetical protein
MNRPGHEDTNFFVGTEVEASPAVGRRTLFVVGLQTNEAIDWKRGEIDARSKLPITHIYFGANQSFPALDKNDGDGWRDWEYMIQHFLDKHWTCTLDLDVAQAEGLLESSLVEYHNFIPMLSVKIPHVRQFPYGTTVKIDDRDVQATNPGVWCHSLHALQRRSAFTDWSKYTQDEVIK